VFLVEPHVEPPAGPDTEQYDQCPDRPPNAPFMKAMRNTPLKVTAIA